MNECSPSDLAEIDTFLRAWPHVTLATCDAQGQPQAATISVAVTAQRELVFDTLGDTHKHANLLNDQRVAVVVGWDDHRTLQCEGLAERLVAGSDDYIRLQADYLARFPSGHERLSWPGLSYFCIRLTWLRFSDFSAVPRIIELDAAALEAAGPSNQLAAP